MNPQRTNKRADYCLLTDDYQCLQSLYKNLPFARSIFKRSSIFMALLGIPFQFCLFSQLQFTIFSQKKKTSGDLIYRVGNNSIQLFSQWSVQFTSKQLLIVYTCLINDYQCIFRWFRFFVCSLLKINVLHNPTARLHGWLSFTRCFYFSAEHVAMQD